MSTKPHSVGKAPAEDDDDKVFVMQENTSQQVLSAPQENPTISYTVFSRRQKRTITVMIGVAMFFSPMTANIYFPCIPALQNSMGVSLQLVNLTITGYIFLQGISPLFLGDLADKIGRRPVYLLTFILYTLASLGLALNRRSYAALLSLRMLQSAGCSATAAVSYGVLADVAMPAERGHMLGLAMIAANLGPSIGPLIGGVLTERAGWRWVFWFMVILGGSFMLTLLAFFPETARGIVGNGSVPAHGWNRTLISYLCNWHEKNLSAVENNQDTPIKRKRRFPNPLEALRILLYRDASLVLWMSAVYYTAYYCVQASLPDLLASLYGFNELQTGLSYLAIGVGVALGGYINGKFLDVNYRITAEQIGFTIDKVSGDDLRVFPIEKARTRFAFYLIILCTAQLIGYGWALQQKTHVGVLLSLQCSLGFVTTCIVQTYNTLLVDIFSSNPSTAAASGNVTRCILSAAVIATMQPLFQSLGHGWFFTLLGTISGATGVIATTMIRTKGKKWRNARLA